MPYMGELGAVGLGRETTWGTAVAPVRFTPVDRCDLQAEMTVAPLEAITGTRGVRRVVSGPTRYRGTVVGPVSGDTIGEWLLMALGARSTAELVAPGGGNPGVYQHTFSRLESATLPSYTVEVNMGGLTSRRVAGARAAALSLIARPGSVLGFECDLVAKTEAEVTPATVAYPADVPLHHSSFTASIDGVATTEVEDLDLSISTGLQDSIVSAGSGGEIARLPAGGALVEGRMTVAFESLTRYHDFKNATERSLLFGFSGGTITAGEPWALSVRVTRARLTAASAPLAPGRLVYEVGFVALNDPGNQEREVEVTVVNGVGAY